MGAGRKAPWSGCLRKRITPTGGTGRFAGALGSFAIVGTSVNSLVTVRIDGYLVRNRECD
jgi:hypothetical protein